MRVSIGCSRLTGETFGCIYIHEGSKPGLWSHKRQLLLRNGLVNTSPWHWIFTINDRRTVGRSALYWEMKTTVNKFCGEESSQNLS
jgi:hypothetical protein